MIVGTWFGRVTSTGRTVLTGLSRNNKAAFTSQYFNIETLKCKGNTIYQMPMKT